MVLGADNKHMYSIIFILALLALIALAGFFGHDSRPQEHNRHQANIYPPQPKSVSRTPPAPAATASGPTAGASRRASARGTTRWVPSAFGAVADAQPRRPARRCARRRA